MILNALNTMDVVSKFGGQAVLSKTGHAFVKNNADSDAYTVGKCQLTTTLSFSYCDN